VVQDYLEIVNAAFLGFVLPCIDLIHPSCYRKNIKSYRCKEYRRTCSLHAFLVLLAKNTNIKIKDQMFDQLAEYMEFHIEARYPDEKKDFYQKCSEEFTTNKINEMYEVSSVRLTIE
jgi:hypothetical protein